MATNFPTSLDSYTNVADGNTIQISTTNNQQDAIEALEAKVGIDSSAVTTSHDYKINAIETIIESSSAVITSHDYQINAIETIIGSASAADLTKLHAVTATADELNILDGVTATADELNILDGVTATADELNILDGVTADKDELNKLDADSDYNCGFRAYVNTSQQNVTGSGVYYSLIGSFFTESFDDGAVFSNGIFTAPVTSNKYHFGITLCLSGATSSHQFMMMDLFTTSKIYRVCQINLPWNDSGAIIPIHIDNIPMSASDTAYWRITITGGDKVVDVLNNTEIWGGLRL